MAKVTHKNKTFQGKVLGVEFDKGEAEVNLPGHLAFFDQHEEFTVKGKVDLDKALDVPVENPGAKE